MSDDKLQKSESAIEVSGNIGEAIERAVSKDDKPAETGKSAITVWPGMLDVCKCGHMYSQHNYSDSLGSKTDPLGFMYECRGEGFSYGRMPDDDRKPLCACRQFEYSAENTPSPKMAPVQQFSRCIANPDDNIGPHDCPGGMAGSDGKMYFCKCSCAVCLKAERRAQGLNDSITPVFTDDRTCIAFGELGGDHTGCPVVVTSGSRIPTVCMCDCKDCKRKWFSDGRPVVRQGKIVRATPETVNSMRPSINAMFQSAEAARIERVLGDDRPEDMLLPPEPRVDLLEVAKSLRKCTHPMHAVKTTKYGDEPCGKCYLITADNFCNQDCRCCRGLPSIDPVGPSIALTVEPLNPVLRAEGSREIAPLSEQETGRLFRTSVPAGEYKATVASAKIITDKNGRPQLAIEMKVEGSDEIMTVPVPSVDAEMVKEFVRVLGDDLDKPAVIGPLAAATSCEARGMDGVISVRCILPPGHKGTHIAEPLMPNRRRLEWSGE